MKLRAALLQLKFQLWRSGPSPSLRSSPKKANVIIDAFSQTNVFFATKSAELYYQLYKSDSQCQQKNVASPPPVTCGIMNIKRTKPTLSSSHRRPSISFYGIASLNSSHNCSQRLLMGSPQQMEASSPGRPP